MSLGRLLATGKSLVSGQNRVGRYRLSKQMGLPKFGSPRNPFASEVNTESPPSPVVKSDRPVPGIPVAARATEESSPPPALIPRLARALRRSSDWFGRANPFSHFAKPAAPKKSALPCFTKPPVQSELCLDNVQVVRNDLSDADVEVVPVAPAGVNPGWAAAGQGESAGKAWGRLATRIFGPNHT